MLEYPKEFVDKVKDMFPNDIELGNALDAGDLSVGSVLPQKALELLDLTIEWDKIYGETLK